MEPTSARLTAIAMVAASVFVIGVGAVVVRALEPGACDFEPVAAPVGGQTIERSDFRVSLPPGWVAVDLKAPDRRAEIDRAAAGSEKLRQFFETGTSGLPSGGRIVAALRDDPSEGNLLLESPETDIPAGAFHSEDFNLLLRIVMEQAGLRIVSLEVCDFTQDGHDAKWVSYDLVDVSGGSRVEARVAFVHVGTRTWDLVMFGDDGEQIERVLRPIVEGFEVKASPA